jgi:hypothetical protein
MPSSGTKNLGQVAVFHRGQTPPANKELLWKDTNFTPSKLKEWSVPANDWLPVGANVVVQQQGDTVVAPVVTLTASNPVRQFGGNPSAAATTLTWHIERPLGCGEIIGINVNGLAVVPPTPNTQDGSLTVDTPLNVDTVHTITVATDTVVNRQATATATVKWLHKRLFVALPKTQNVWGLSDAQLSALFNGLPAKNWDLATGYSQTARIFTGTPTAPVRVYEVFLDPSQQATFRVNGVQNNAWITRNFHYTNSDGYATDFRLCAFQREVTGKLSVDTY